MKSFSSTGPRMYRAAIAAWQRFLESKGFYSGPITGDFDHRTSEATAKYQARARIEVSGELDSQTIQRAERDGFRQPTDRPDRDHFRTDGDVRLPYGHLRELSQIAWTYYLWTGKDLTITSGTRTAEQQAEVMYENWYHGWNPGTRYRNEEAAKEIRNAYEEGLQSHADERTTVTTMANVIEEQMRHHVYVSMHLVEGAVDVRTKDMSHEQAHRLKDAADDVGVEHYREEDHYHLQF